jgi:hypothetical protein
MRDFRLQKMILRFFYILFAFQFIGSNFIELCFEKVGSKSLIEIQKKSTENESNDNEDDSFEKYDLIHFSSSITRLSYFSLFLEQNYIFVLKNLPFVFFRIPIPPPQLK